jgi:hypothetical protein
MVVLYQHAVRRPLEARTRVQDMVSALTRAAATLDGDRWKSAAGAQSPGVSGFKATADGRVNLAEMPSGRDVMTALAEWREAWEAVGKAWQALPPDNQVGLREPKELY